MAPRCGTRRREDGAPEALAGQRVRRLLLVAAADGDVSLTTNAAASGAAWHGSARTVHAPLASLSPAWFSGRDTDDAHAEPDVPQELKWRVRAEVLAVRSAVHMYGCRSLPSEKASADLHVARRQQRPLVGRVVDAAQVAASNTTTLWPRSSSPSRRRGPKRPRHDRHAGPAADGPAAAHRRRDGGASASVSVSSTVSARARAGRQPHPPRFQQHVTAGAVDTAGCASAATPAIGGRAHEVSGPLGPTSTSTSTRPRPRPGLDLGVCGHEAELWANFSGAARRHMPLYACWAHVGELRAAGARAMACSSPSRSVVVRRQAVLVHARQTRRGGISDDDAHDACRAQCHLLLLGLRKPAMSSPPGSMSNGAMARIVSAEARAPPWLAMSTTRPHMGHHGAAPSAPARCRPRGTANYVPVYNIDSGDLDPVDELPPDVGGGGGGGGDASGGDASGDVGDAPDEGRLLLKHATAGPRGAPPAPPQGARRRPRSSWPSWPSTTSVSSTHWFARVVDTIGYNDTQPHLNEPQVRHALRRTLRARPRLAHGREPVFFVGSRVRLAGRGGGSRVHGRPLGHPPRAHVPVEGNGFTLPYHIVRERGELTASIATLAPPARRLHLVCGLLVVALRGLPALTWQGAGCCGAARPRRRGVLSSELSSRVQGAAAAARPRSPWGRLGRVSLALLCAHRLMPQCRLEAFRWCPGWAGSGRAATPPLR